jgi:hypothetical protein
MQQKVQNLLLNNSTLKISACIIGFLLWSILNESQRARITVTVPVCFYNLPSSGAIKAPEQIQVTLSGTHSQLRNLDPQALAVHINAAQLHEGVNVIDMSSEHLLLPPEINLVKYKPIHLIFTLALP